MDKLRYARLAIIMGKLDALRAIADDLRETLTNERGAFDERDSKRLWKRYVAITVTIQNAHEEVADAMNEEWEES